MKRIIVFRVMFAACLAHLAAEEFPNKKCFVFSAPTISTMIQCINGVCQGHLTIFGRLGLCFTPSDVVCSEFVVPNEIQFPVMSMSVPAGMGTCGADNEFICMPDMMNGNPVFNPDAPATDCL